MTGFKPSTERFRTFGGTRFLGGWILSPTPQDFAAYRKAGVRCRKVDGEMFIAEADRPLALKFEGIESGGTP